MNFEGTYLHDGLADLEWKVLHCTRVVSTAKMINNFLADIIELQMCGSCKIRTCLIVAVLGLMSTTVYLITWENQFNEGNFTPVL